MKRESYDTIPIPEELDLAIKKGIEKGKKIRRKKRQKAVLTACGSLAAVCALFVTVCIANPTLASNIPFVGKIFEKVEDNADFTGDYSEHSTHLADTLPDADVAEPAIEENIQTDTYQQLEELYGDTNQNITITPEEIYCDGISLYLGLRLTTTDEEGFGIISEDYRIELRGTVDFDEKSHDFHTWLIGSPEDLYTFIGMIKLPAEGITDSVDEVQVNVETIFWTHEINRDKKYEDPDLDILYHFLKDGGWHLSVPVTIDTSRSKTYEINDVNEAGYGIETINITPYEIQVKPVKPHEGPDENGYTGCFAVFNDNGEYFAHGEWDETEAFIVDGKSAEHLYFYFFEDEFVAVKCWDQTEAENGCIYKYELITN